MAQKSKSRKLMLSLAIAAALGCASGSAFADGDRVAELEDRIAELEAMVQQLMNQQRQAPPPPDTAKIEAQAEAIADLIDSATAQAARAAVRSLHGEFSARVHVLQQQHEGLHVFPKVGCQLVQRRVYGVHRPGRR